MTRYHSRDCPTAILFAISEPLSALLDQPSKRYTGSSPAGTVKTARRVLVRQFYCAVKTLPSYLHANAFTPSLASSVAPSVGERSPEDQLTAVQRENARIEAEANGYRYKCDHPGCSAAPFSTQYLLNAHSNVHSSARPHYCPVKGCSRSEGGRGFKRKNEMIRHGLIHESPGYICPFCPDRDHKYPRPDNLQRYVPRINCSHPVYDAVVRM